MPMTRVPTVVTQTVINKRVSSVARSQQLGAASLVSGGEISSGHVSSSHLASGILSSSHVTGVPCRTGSSSHYSCTPLAPIPSIQSLNNSGILIEKGYGHHLALVVKLNLGLFNDVTDEDIEELFSYLDEDGSGYLDSDEFSKLLKYGLSPPCEDADVEALFSVIDKSPDSPDGDGNVTLADLKLAFTSGTFRSALTRVQTQAAKERVEQAVRYENGPIVPRDLLIKRIAWRISRDDSFFTLPYTIIFIIVFVSVVITHLQIFKRQQVQQAIETWIDGYGNTYPGPYLDDHVADIQQMWDWMNFSGLPSVLGSCTRKDDAPCEAAPGLYLVTDVRIFRTHLDGSETSKWLLHSPEAQNHLAANPEDRLGAARKALEVSWRSNIWAPLVDTARLGMVFTAYTEESETFSVTKSSIEFRSSGIAITDSICRAVVINPYSNLSLWIIDALYVFLVVWAFSFEAQQICARGCIGYFDHCGMEGIWNAVDLFGIFMGFLNVAQWVLFILSIQSDDIQKLLYESAGKLSLKNNIMGIDLGTLESLESRLTDISQQIFIMQLAMGFNVLSIMMKLFKAFGANSRLQLVSNTIINAAEDLFHFGFVFGALFLGFALTGHILFGEDIEEFRSLSQSLNTAFEGLLGAFEWYTVTSLSPKRLGSGMPYFMVVVWFYVFIIFVVLVMMNMLLAIVMDHYTNLLMEVRGDPDNAPTLWSQTARMYQRYKAAKHNGFIPNDKLLFNLADAVPPCHPEYEVTQESLLRSFNNCSRRSTVVQTLDNMSSRLSRLSPDLGFFRLFRRKSSANQKPKRRISISGMPEPQAESIIAELKRQAAKIEDQENVGEDPDVTVFGEIKDLIASLTDQVRLVTHQTSQCNARIESLERICFALTQKKEAASADPPAQNMPSAGIFGPAAAEQRAYDHFPKDIEELKCLVKRLKTVQERVHLPSVPDLPNGAWDDTVFPRQPPVPTRSSPCNQCSLLASPCDSPTLASGQASS